MKFKMFPTVILYAVLNICLQPMSFAKNEFQQLKWQLRQVFVRFKRGFVHFLYLLGVNVTRYSSISSFVSWLIHYII